MGKFRVFTQNLVMQAILELYCLLNVTLKVHLELKALLISIQQDKPTWIVGVALAVSWELEFPSSITSEW